MSALWEKQAPARLQKPEPKAAKKPAAKAPAKKSAAKK